MDAIITYRSGKDEAAAAVEALEARGRTAVALRLDTTEFDNFAGFAESVRQELSTRWNRDSFDFLVNNAGSIVPTPTGKATEEAFDQMIDLHFKGVVFLTQALLPLLADGGRIVNLTSAVTRMVTGDMSIYAAAKSAIDTYSRYLAHELGQRRITVNTVAPGPIATDFGGGQMRDNEKFREVVGAQAALGRVGEPDDIGAAIASLLAPDNGWVTAQRIEVSGGMNL
ncbi:NAD(P)-dependent dehydrogenase (short-subunit alcohol dehydrogenase family) [Amycolatopsis jiangsuensis]|uniref:NAD(P)-dependent dehydrogenase (Short-subunit alcohol dehydrogenase family) n=1 Tax=Amycolatopsis jiangsuensis TaxID=1181879 RepID=A0A840J716_9PSEU|nr:NAD(P)-dependent dehydrogenase (short-subunit alcohol dehydrogenase family) [Amycolatopsis jiangsuensis]